MIAGANSAGFTAASWARAMLRMALTDAISEQNGVLAQGQATIGKRNTAEQAWVEAETAKLRALEAQLAALAVAPTVPVEPGP
jgi:hypothetical protein